MESKPDMKDYLYLYRLVVFCHLYCIVMIAYILSSVFHFCFCFTFSFYTLLLNY